MIYPARYDMPTAYAGNSFGPIDVRFDDETDVSAWSFQMQIMSGVDVLQTVSLGSGLSIVEGNILRIGPFTVANPSASQSNIRYEMRVDKGEGTNDAFLVGAFYIDRDDAP